MKKGIIEANKYLVHNVRHSLLDLKLMQRHIAEIALDIEKTLNLYREIVEDLVNGDGTDLSDGKNSEDE